MKDCSCMPDAELLGSLKELVKHGRRNLVRILRHLAEMDKRRLALKLGYRSLFDYCVRELRYSEPETGRRIQAARAAARLPLLYRMLASGRLSLTAVSMLAPHLTDDNHRDLIRRSLGLSKRGLEALLAESFPMREPQDRVRHLGARGHGPAPAASSTPAEEGRAALPAGAAEEEGSLFQATQDACPSEPASASACPTERAFASVCPTGRAPASSSPNGDAAMLAGPEGSIPFERGARMAPAGADGEGRGKGAGAGRVHLSFTVDEALWRWMERARRLLRHKHPRGRLEEILSEALDALLERIDPERRLRRKTPGEDHPGGASDSKGQVQGLNPGGRRGREGRRGQDGPRGSVVSPDARGQENQPGRTGTEPHLPTGEGHPSTRHIPRRVREEVWLRDGGRCAYRGMGGRRCSATAGLEFDHITPWALGGRSDDPVNIRLLCAAHNQLEARRVFGDAAIDRALGRVQGRATALHGRDE